MNSESAAKSGEVVCLDTLYVIQREKDGGGWYDFAIHTASEQAKTEISNVRYHGTYRLVRRTIKDLLMNTPTGIEAEVCEDIALRQAKGIAKYGMMVGENPLELRAWVQHMYEELLDAAVYARRIIDELDRNNAKTR